MHSPTLLDSLEIFNYVEQGILVTDIKGSILYSNSVVERIFGLQSKENEGNSLRSYFSEEDYLKFESIMEKCKKERICRGKWHVKTNSGELKWLVISLKFFQSKQQNEGQFIFSINNIEKLQKTRENLKKISMQVKTIFEHSADAIITADSNGNILKLSRTAVDMFGYQKNEIINDNIKQLIPSLDFKNGKLFLKRDGFESKHIKYGDHVDLHGKRKDGTFFFVNINFSNFSWNDGQILVGIIRDLTEKRNLEKHMVDIANEERRRIGRELHDGLGQMLSGIRMVAENLARRLSANELPGANEIQEISEMIGEADEYSRKLARGLVEVDHEEMGLSQALKGLAEQVSKNSSVECTFTDIGEVTFKNHKNALNIYRIAQEAVTNALRHSRARHIRIQLSADTQQIILTVDDDGVGFKKEKDDENGLGIKTMKYRADIMGGRLDVYRTCYNKTVVKCTIPKNSELLHESNILVNKKGAT